MTKKEIIDLGAGRGLDRLVAEKVMGWKRSVNDSFEDNDNWIGDRGAGWFTVGEWHPSLDMAQAWQVFIRALENDGQAAIIADMEDYGRGTYIRGRADAVVTVRVGGWCVMGPVCEAICKAALLNTLEDAT